MNWTVCSFVRPVFLLLNFWSKSFVVIGLRARYLRTKSSVIALPLSPGVGVLEAEPDLELGPGDTRAFLDEGLSLMETNPVLRGSEAGRFLPLPAGRINDCSYYCCPILRSLPEYIVSRT